MTQQLEKTHLTISSTHFFQLDQVDRIASSIELELSDHSYLPKGNDPRSDWVASVAVPAFKTLAQMEYFAPRFCTIGTGAGVDVLAAVEILRADTVGFTDLHEDVLAHALTNIERNLIDGNVKLHPGVGDIFAPLAGKLSGLDVVYENLPNIPLATTGDLGDGQTSSTFIGQRNEAIPGFAEQNLLTLHYLALEQARPALRTGGRILSSIGARVPLSEILKLSSAVGYNGSILTYVWKVQSEPHDVVGGYAEWEREGLGPFHFYPVDVLRDAFEGITPAAAGARAVEIETALAPHQLSAGQALDLVDRGNKVGHTAVILDSVKIPDSAL
jgi:hypothetical protein